MEYIFLSLFNHIPPSKELSPIFSDKLSVLIRLDLYTNEVHYVLVFFFVTKKCSKLKKNGRRLVCGETNRLYLQSFDYLVILSSRLEEFFSFKHKSLLLIT